jgi:hypothetical protein
MSQSHLRCSRHPPYSRVLCTSLCSTRSPPRRTPGTRCHWRMRRSRAGQGGWGGKDCWGTEDPARLAAVLPIDTDEYALSWSDPVGSKPSWSHLGPTQKIGTNVKKQIIV